MQDSGYTEQYAWAERSVRLIRGHVSIVIIHLVVGNVDGANKAS